MSVKERVTTGLIMVASELSKYPYVYSCEKEKCGYSVACESIESGIEEEIFHMCPRQVMLEAGADGKQKRVTIVEQAWRMFDVKFDEYKTHTGGDQVRTSSIAGELTGMSNIIFLLMKPYYETREDVVRELMKRYDDAKAGVEHVTPGIGMITIMPEEGGPPWGPSLSGGYTSDPAGMVNPPLGYPQDLIDEERVRHELRTKKSRATPLEPRAAQSLTPTRTFTEDEITAIKTAQANGFDYKMIMTAYSCTMEELKGVLLPQ